MYPILGKVIARALELTDRLLSEWVGLVPGGSGNPADIFNDDCGPNFTWNASMTVCGEDFVERLEDLIHGGIVFILSVLPGLGATQDVIY